jgi:hypothetical protein
MKQHTKVVWLGYASIVFSIVWGVPGLACGVAALRIARGVPLDGAPAHVRRDIRGGRLLAYIGCTLSSIVLAMVMWIAISTWVLS